MREDSLGKRQNTLKSQPGDNNRNKVPEAYITLSCSISIITLSCSIRENYHKMALLPIFILGVNVESLIAMLVNTGQLFVYRIFLNIHLIVVSPSPLKKESYQQQYHIHELRLIV